MNERIDQFGPNLLLLSLQRALLLEVFPALRSLTVEWTTSTITTYAYIDGPISDDDWNSISVVDGEVIGDIPYPYEVYVDFKTIRHDAPEPIDDGRVCVFHRREPNFSQIRETLVERIRDAAEEGVSYDNPRLKRRVEVLLAFQRALLGEVFPALRELSAEWSDDEVGFTAYIDGTPLEEDVESIRRIRKNLESEFGEHTTVSSEITRCDEPTLIKNIRVPTTNETQTVYAKRTPSILDPYH